MASISLLISAMAKGLAPSCLALSKNACCCGSMTLGARVRRPELPPACEGPAIRSCCRDVSRSACLSNCERGVEPTEQSAPLSIDWNAMPRMTVALTVQLCSHPRRPSSLFSFRRPVLRFDSTSSTFASRFCDRSLLVSVSTFLHLHRATHLPLSQRATRLHSHVYINAIDMGNLIWHDLARLVALTSATYLLWASGWVSLLSFD